MYCGKLVIKQHKDEVAYIVDAQHEPLVSQALFYDVQDCFEWKKTHTCGQAVVTGIATVKEFSQVQQMPPHAYWQFVKR